MQISIGILITKPTYWVAYVKGIINSFQARVSASGGEFKRKDCLKVLITNLNNIGLLRKASLIITANAYNSGVIYDVIPNTPFGDMDFNRATEGMRVGADLLLDTVQPTYPRLDYTGGGCPTWLVEPQRTNLCLVSKTFDNRRWNKISSNVIGNTTIAPTGAQDADTLDILAAGGFIFQNIIYSNTVGQTATLSLYVKNTTVNFISFLGFASGTDVYSIQNFGGGWYRHIVTRTFTASTASINSQFKIGNGVKASSDIWGAQFETGSYVTSHIQTSTSQVTRNADVISKTGISNLIGQTEGTIFSSFYYSGNATSSLQIYPLYIGQGTFVNSVTIGLFENALLCRVFTGGVEQNYFTSSALSIGNHKVAFVYANNNLKLFLDGVLIASDTSASIPTCSQIYIGSSGTTTNTEKINVNNNLIFKTALTDAECIALTTL